MRSSENAGSEAASHSVWKHSELMGKKKIQAGCVSDITLLTSTHMSETKLFVRNSHVFVCVCVCCVAHLFSLLCLPYY